MRILLVTHEFLPYPGGIATYSAELAQAAQELGHEVTVVAPDFATGDLGLQDDTGSYRIWRFRGGRFRRRVFVSLLLRAARLSRYGEFDLVHAVDWPFIAALTLVNRVRDVPFVATAYGTDVLSLEGSPYFRLLGLRNMFEVPKRVFAISEYTKSLLLQACPNIDPGRVVTTPLGVSPYWFEEAGGSEELLARLGISTGRKIILTVARLDERKGHRTVLAALGSLPDELKSQLTYVVVGKTIDTAYLAEIRRLAQASGAQVVFTGAVSREDLRRLYSLAYFLCMPGEPHPVKVEGFGLVYLEAAAQGAPSIASDVAAVPEVVRDGCTGVLVPPQASDALAEKIQNWAEHPEKVVRLGQAAKDWARKFTWRACAERTYGPGRDG